MSDEKGLVNRKYGALETVPNFASDVEPMRLMHLRNEDPSSSCTTDYNLKPDNRPRNVAALATYEGKCTGERHTCDLADAA